ncbi:MAG: hypothetical protein EA428_14360 [Spirochaetaceae bacterium]|nr:MAG: hypothetical protein EA428_14360 [Spirochaetaceae bacterium]
MVLFLLASIPLTYFFILGFSGQSDQPRQHTLLAVVRGSLWAVPAIGILAILRFLIGGGFSTGRLYLMYGVGEVLAPFVVAGIGIALLERQSLNTDLSAALTGLTSFLSGYLSVLSFFEIARYLQHFDSAVLFVLPLVRTAFLVACPLLFLIALREQYGTRYLALAIGIGALALLSWIPTFYYLSFQIPALFSALVVAVSAGLILLYLGKQNLPSRR